MLRRTSDCEHPLFGLPLAGQKLQVHPDWTPDIKTSHPGVTKGIFKYIEQKEYVGQSDVLHVEAWSHRIRVAIGREGRGSLPDRNPHHREAVALCFLKNKKGDMFHRRIFIDYKDRFFLLLERL